MPTFRRGNIFNHFDECSLLLVTTNSYVNKKGSLVMGRGAAEEAAKRFPGCAQRFGALVKACPNYDVIFDPNYPKPRLGIFRVKAHFEDRAEKAIIAQSVKRLVEIATNPHWKVVPIYINFPGIGYGGASTFEGSAPSQTPFRQCDYLAVCVTQKTHFTTLQDLDRIDFPITFEPSGWLDLIPKKARPQFYILVD